MEPHISFGVDEPEFPFDTNERAGAELQAPFGKFIDTSFNKGFDFSLFGGLANISNILDAHGVPKAFPNSPLADATIGLPIRGLLQLDAAIFNDDSLKTPTGRLLSEEEANEIYGIPGKLDFAGKGPQRIEIAQLKHDESLRRIRMDEIIESTDGFWKNTAGFMVEMMGSLSDPISAPLVVVPTFTLGIQARTAARMGQVKGLAVLGATDAVVNTTIATTPSIVADRQLQQDTDALAGMFSIAFAGVFGGAIGAARGRFSPIDIDQVYLDEIASRFKDRTGDDLFELIDTPMTKPDEMTPETAAKVNELSVNLLADDTIDNYGTGTEGFTEQGVDQIIELGILEKDILEKSVGESTTRELGRKIANIENELYDLERNTSVSEPFRNRKRGELETALIDLKEARSKDHAVIEAELKALEENMAKMSDEEKALFEERNLLSPDQVKAGILERREEMSPGVKESGLTEVDPSKITRIPDGKGRTISASDIINEKRKLLKLKAKQLLKAGEEKNELELELSGGNKTLEQRALDEAKLNEAREKVIQLEKDIEEIQLFADSVRRVMDLLQSFDPRSYKQLDELNRSIKADYVQYHKMKSKTSAEKVSKKRFKDEIEIKEAQSIKLAKELKVQRAAEIKKFHLTEWKNANTRLTDQATEQDTASSAFGDAGLQANNPDKYDYRFPEGDFNARTFAVIKDELELKLSDMLHIEELVPAAKALMKEANEITNMVEDKAFGPKIKEVTICMNYQDLSITQKKAYIRNQNKPKLPPEIQAKLDKSPAVAKVRAQQGKPTKESLQGVKDKLESGNVKRAPVPDDIEL